MRYNGNALLPGICIYVLPMRSKCLVGSARKCVCVYDICKLPRQDLFAVFTKLQGHTPPSAPTPLHRTTLLLAACINVFEASER